MIANIENTIIKRKRKPDGMFFMRLHNKGSSSVTVKAHSSATLFDNYTGNPVLIKAVVERSDGTETNIKGTANSGNSTLAFSVVSGESCVYRIIWDGGLFSIGATSNVVATGYADLVVSGGCEIYGNYDIPNYFMGHLFRNCKNYNQQPGDIFDMAGLFPSKIGNNFCSYTWYDCISLTNAVAPIINNWTVNSLGNSFFYATWRGCTSLLVAAIPDTTNWNITTIGTNFLYQCWYGCSSLTVSVAPNTTNWSITTIGTGFLQGTYRNSPSLTVGVVPDASNWNVSTIGTGFMTNTWTSSFTAGGENIITLKGNIYTGSIRLLGTNSGGLTNAKTTNVKVDSSLISIYQSISSWSNIDDIKFISW
jgi:hypothetical protein